MDDTEVVGMEYRDASGLSTRSTTAGTASITGTNAYNTEELDGLGNNVGTFGDLSPMPRGNGLSPYEDISITEPAEQQCTVNGMTGPCEMVTFLSGNSGDWGTFFGNRRLEGSLPILAQRVTAGVENNPMYIAHEIINMFHLSPAVTSMNWATGQQEYPIDVPRIRYGQTLLGHMLGYSPVPVTDNRYGIDELVTAAQEVIKNATGECLDLLGPGALTKFSEIATNISYDDENLNVPLSVEARTIGEKIFLNPWSMTFNEDYREFREEDKEINKPTLKLRKQFNKSLRKYNQRLEDFGVSSFEYAVAGIIHEFLHAAGKWGPDSGSQSMKNQEKVLKKCFTMGETE